MTIFKSTKQGPLIDFTLSTNAKSLLASDRFIAFIDNVESLIEPNGNIHKTEGLIRRSQLKATSGHEERTS